MKNLGIFAFVIMAFGCHGLNASTKGDNLSLQQKMDAQPVSNTTSGRQRRARLTTRESTITRALVSTKTVSTKQTNNQASSATSTKPVTKAVATVLAASSASHHAPVARPLTNVITSSSSHDSAAKTKKWHAMVDSINQYSRTPMSSFEFDQDQERSAMLENVRAYDLTASKRYTAALSHPRNKEPNVVCDLQWLTYRTKDGDAFKCNFLKDHLAEILQSIQETREMEQHDNAIAGDQEKMAQGVHSALTSPFYFRPIALAPITNNIGAPIRRPTPCFLGLILQNGQFQWALIPKINSI